MWKAKIIPGLPAEGPWPEQFTHDDAPTHSEGVVVRFDQDDGSHWVGNFQPGIGSVSMVLVHPDGIAAVVLARGQAYVVSVTERRALSALGGHITEILEVPDQAILVLVESGVTFRAISKSGTLWRTERISYDGFRNLRVVDSQLFGDAWSPVDNGWFSFRVDLSTGKHVRSFAKSGA